MVEEGLKMRVSCEESKQRFMLLVLQFVRKLKGFWEEKT
jgi:hypothetical protein